MKSFWTSTTTSAELGRATFLIHSAQQKTNSCLVRPPLALTLKMLRSSSTSADSILYGFPCSFLNRALQSSVNSAELRSPSPSLSNVLKQSSMEQTVSVSKVVIIFTITIQRHLRKDC